MSDNEPMETSNRNDQLGDDQLGDDQLGDDILENVNGGSNGSGLATGRRQYQPVVATSEPNGFATTMMEGSNI